MRAPTGSSGTTTQPPPAGSLALWVTLCPPGGASRHRVRRRGRGLRRRVRHLPGRRRADAGPPRARMELLPGHVPPSARALLRAHGLAVALPSAPQAHLQAIVSAPAWWMNAQSPPTYGHLSGRSRQGGETQHPQLIPRRARAPPGARGCLAAVAHTLRRPCVGVGVLKPGLTAPMGSC